MSYFIVKLYICITCYGWDWKMAVCEWVWHWCGTQVCLLQLENIGKFHPEQIKLCRSPISNTHFPSKQISTVNSWGVNVVSCVHCMFACDLCAHSYRVRLMSCQQKGMTFPHLAFSHHVQKALTLAAPSDKPQTEAASVCIYGPWHLGSFQFNAALISNFW